MTEIKKLTNELIECRNNTIDSLDESGVIDTTRFHIYSELTDSILVKLLERVCKLEKEIKELKANKKD